MWNVEWGMRHGNVLPQITQIFTDAVRADISKNTRPGEAYRTIQTLAVILKNTNLSNLSNDY